MLARELSIDEIRKIRERDDDAAGGVRPRRAVRGLLGPVPDERIARRPQRQPRPVCPGLPAAVRAGLRRPATSIWASRSICSARRTWRRYDLVPELIDAGVCSLQDRRPAEDARVRRQHHAALSPGDRRGAGRPAGRVHAAATSRRWSSRSRAASRPAGCDGCDHKMLVPGHQLGEARRAAGRGARRARRARRGASCRARSSAGDGVVFEGDRADGRRAGRPRLRSLSRRPVARPSRSTGARRTGLRPRRDRLRRSCRPASRSGRPTIRELTRAAAQDRSTAPSRSGACRSICACTAAVGRAAASSTARGRRRRRAAIESPEPLAAARKHPLTRGRAASSNSAGWAARSTSCAIARRPKSPAGRWCRSACSASCGTRWSRSWTQSAQVAAAARAIAARAALPARGAAARSRAATPSRRSPQLARALPFARAAAKPCSSCGVRSVYGRFPGHPRVSRGGASWRTRRGAKSSSPRRAFRSRTRWASFARWPSTGPTASWSAIWPGCEFCREHGIPFVADFSLNAANELTVD